MHVYTYGHPILRKVAEPVQSVTSDVVEIIASLHETLAKSGGYGLSAPQIGHSCRIIAFNGSQDKKELKIVTMINPEIINEVGELVPSQEGCWSLPGLPVKVGRHQRIQVSYIDQDGQNIIGESYCGLNAFIIQHEIDHLNGKLICDYAHGVVRNMVVSKLKKISRRIYGNRLFWRDGEEEKS